MASYFLIEYPLYLRYNWRYSVYRTKITTTPKGDCYLYAS